MSGPTYRRTWAKWRERNMGNYDEAIRHARVGHLDRAPEVVGNRDCLSWQLSPGHYSASPEVYAAYGPMLDRLNKGWPVRTGEPVWHSYDLEGERVNLVYWDEETDLREMQAKVNEMVARMAELQQHYGYTWVGNPETGEWRLRREAHE